MDDEERKKKKKKRKKEKEKKKDDGVATSLASEGTDLLVDLWEARPCFWDPE